MAGGQKQVWLLARALQRLGADQVVVTLSGSELARRLLAERIQTRPVPWTIGIDPRAGWAVWRERGAGSIFDARDTAFAAELVKIDNRTVESFSDPAMAERMLAVYRSRSQATGNQ